MAPDKEILSFTTQDGWTHCLVPQGYLFHWTAEYSFIDSEGESQTTNHDYGLVSREVYNMVKRLVQGERAEMEVIL